MATERCVRRFLSSSPLATETLGMQLGRALGSGAVVALSGDLGAGKTCFVRGLARGLDVEEATASPTFTLMQEHAGRVPFFHFDAWMAGREALFLEGGGADYLGGDGVCAVEWAERIERYLPQPRIDLLLGHRAPEERMLEFRLVRCVPESTGPTPPPSELESELEAALTGLRRAEDLVELSGVSGHTGEPGPDPSVGTGEDRHE